VTLVDKDMREIVLRLRSAKIRIAARLESTKTGSIMLQSPETEGHWG